MQTAEVDAFCTSVPNVRDVPQTLAWAASACTSERFVGSHCPKYLQAFVTVCTEQIEKRKITLGETFERGLEKGRQP